MANMIVNMVKNSMDVDDKLICESMLASAKEMIDLYLNSALTSTTPELRAIYSAAVVQGIEGHTALTELAVTKGWLKPYVTPIEQLTCSYNSSKKAVEEVNKK